MKNLKNSKKKSGGNKPRRKTSKKKPQESDYKQQQYVHTNQHLFWGPSGVKGAGNGVFTSKAFKKGDVVEIAPIIRDSNDNWGSNNKIANYTTTSDDNNSSLTLGYGSLYNHSNKNNIDYYLGDNDTFIFIANKGIKKNSELFISYGDDWWNSRTNFTQN